MKAQKMTSIKAYKSAGFIGKYQKLIKDTVIPYQYDILSDRIEEGGKSHVIANFINAGKALKGEDIGDGFMGMVFQDSDAAKWLEAAAYSLGTYPSSELEKTADELIDIIASAQDEDGYIDTPFIIKDRDKRWTNLLEAHELYCAGHMMEAACAYYEATGKDKLLNVMLKNAEHIYKVFIEDKHEGYPGHPEVELALMRMYHTTKNLHCLELAEHFINVRGVDREYFYKEKIRRGWNVWGNNPVDYDYQQSGAPVREQKDAVGHSVRAVYLYTGMADLASQSDDAELYTACKALWNSITKKRMYITGGIGSTYIGEAFTADYNLPPDTAYCETCASIGLMFFASRMLEHEINGEYGDVMETAFYNTVLAGMQLDGKRFFYVNPLEAIPGISGRISTHRHVLPQRPGWYACACCPPNTARLIASFGKYAYGESSDTAYCHMFAAGDVSFENGISLNCETEYPYGFAIKYKVTGGAGKLAVRIPSWSKTCELYKNGEKASLKLEKGYAYFDVLKGDEIKVVLDDSARFVYPSAKIADISGRAAVCRGPLVYCFEGTDNGGDVLSLSLVTSRKLSLTELDGDAIKGIAAIEAEAVRTIAADELYSSEPPKTERCRVVAVPYYAWGNRGENQMRVWMDYTK